jgi:hypothetical protein
VYRAAILTSRGINADSAALINPDGSWNGTAGVKNRRIVSGAAKQANCFLFYPMPGAFPPLHTSALADSTAATTATLLANNNIFDNEWRNPYMKRKNFSAPIDFCPYVFFRLNPLSDADLTWAQNILGKVTITVVQ